MKVAAIQMTSGPDVTANLEQARALLEDASARGARLAALPENFSFMGLKDSDKRAVAETEYRLQADVLEAALSGRFTSEAELFARARGLGRRGRTVRGDATVEGLVRLIERHFGLERYGFEVRIVHAGSGRRVPAGDELRKYRVEA